MLPRDDLKHPSDEIKYRQPCQPLIDREDRIGRQIEYEAYPLRQPGKVLRQHIRAPRR